MTLYGIGIDVVEIERFASFKKNKSHRFLANNFSSKELAYCFAFEDSSIHLAGTFSAKEAVWKVLGQKNLLMSLIEIRRNKSGQPTVWLRNKQQKSVLVSISHTKKISIAIAIKV